MDNCKEVLDKILQDTKKKASSKLKVADKKLYEQVLMEMLQAEGFSDATEKYIYDGLKFCGAKPLKEYICHAKNPVDVFHRFTRGNLYGKKTTETARMVFSLFGLCLNDRLQEVELLAAIIMRIPTVVMNKEKKLDGNAPKYVEQFFKTLNNDVVLPTAKVMNEAGLQMGAMRNFNQFIAQIKGQYDFSKMDIACQKKMSMLENWFVPESPKATEEQALQLEEKQAKPVQPVKKTNPMPKNRLCLKMQSLFLKMIMAIVRLIKKISRQRRMCRLSLQVMRRKLKICSSFASRNSNRWKGWNWRRDGLRPPRLAATTEPNAAPTRRTRHIHR